MARPLIVTIPHNLGRELAIERIRRGIEQVSSKYADKFNMLEETWTGDRLDFNLAALKQTVSGSIEVAESSVTITVMLPFLLSVFADKARTFIESRSKQILLGKQ